MAEYLNKLKSILARRGSDWGIQVPSGNPTSEQLNAFAQHIVNHIANASEVRRTPYGTWGDRLFHITGTEVVVTHLDGTFESTWRHASPAQLGHYRTGVKIK